MRNLLILRLIRLFDMLHRVVMRLAMIEECNKDEGEG